MPRPHRHNSNNEEFEQSQQPTTENDEEKITHTELSVDKPVNKDQWINRRRMAWLSLIFMIFFTVVVVFFLPVDRIKVIEMVLSWYFIGSTSIVGAYMGLATLQDIQTRRK